MPDLLLVMGQDVDLGMVRVNYSFGGPVIAKY